LVAAPRLEHRLAQLAIHVRECVSNALRLLDIRRGRASSGAAADAGDADL